MKLTTQDLLNAILESFSANGEFNNYTATHSAKEIRAMAAKLTKAKPALVETALVSFIEAIDQTGGVTEHTGKHDGGPVGDPEWLDLGDAYRTACAAMNHTPVESALEPDTAW